MYQKEKYLVPFFELESCQRSTEIKFQPILVPKEEGSGWVLYRSDAWGLTLRLHPVSQNPECWSAGRLAKYESWSIVGIGSGGWVEGPSPLGFSFKGWCL